MFRAFKTAWFSKEARRASIRDSELCDAISQVAIGQADDLGGGVFKKRLNENQHRSIILAKGGEFWVFSYLFAKNDRANISRNELDAFRQLAGIYRQKTAGELEKELKVGAIEEICHEKHT